MWLEDTETIQTWVNGGEVILKKVDREYAYRRPMKQEIGLTLVHLSERVKLSLLL